MFRYLLATLLVMTGPSFAQDNPVAQKLLPPGVTKAEFFGDLLAVISFCNLTMSIDQYEFGAGMRFFGITSADRPAMETMRDKQYEKFRREVTTPAKHFDFCKAAYRHPILSKAMRRGVPSFIGSDDRRQEEKIEYFGTSMGTLMFCKVPSMGSDGAHSFSKWG